jgi:hypothetical protein
LGGSRIIMNVLVGLLTALPAGYTFTWSAAPSQRAGPVIWRDDFGTGWKENWHVRRQQSWGLENLSVIREPREKFPAVLRVTYPRGSASPTVSVKDGAPVGGAQFLADLGITPTDSLHLRYYVRFAPGFDFRKGGKLPGLYGGKAKSGGKIPGGADGFSTRLMWRKNGAGEVYAYLPTSRQHGTSLGRGNWRFATSRWHLIEQEVILNTPGKADGCIRVWFDDRQVLKQDGLVFRTVPELKINGIFFSTFFGGDDPTWATPATTYVDFATFAVGTGYIGREK